MSCGIDLLFRSFRRAPGEITVAQDLGVLTGTPFEEHETASHDGAAAGVVPSVGRICDSELPASLAAWIQKRHTCCRLVQLCLCCHFRLWIVALTAWMTACANLASRRRRSVSGARCLGCAPLTAGRGPRSELWPVTFADSESIRGVSACKTTCTEATMPA